MTQETGNFRSRLFGGFDKQNVMDYIESLSRERNDLQKENEALREKLMEAKAQIDELKSAAAAERCEEPEQPTVPEPEPPKAVEETVKEALEIVEWLRSRYEEICADVRIDISQTEADVTRLTGKTAGLMETLKSAGGRLEHLARELEERGDLEHEGASN